jgi:DNA-binding NarL/FixJ family response regulator
MPASTRVFIVDDHPLVREWLTTLLHQQGDLVVSGQAADAASALSAMLEDPPEVAVVDLTLRSSSGLDLIKDLTEQLPGTKVVVLSMHDEVFYAERALRAGARGYVIKQEATDRILDAIRQVQAGQLYANPELLARLTERLFSKAAHLKPGSVETLSDRELDVFSRLGHGQSTRRISDELHISIKTVQVYCMRIREKLGIADGVELMREAVRWVESKR